MKILLGILALGALLAMSSIAVAAGTSDPVVGTWKLDAAKSSGNTAMPKSETRTYAASGDGIALTWERVSADGKKNSVKTTFNYDGKDYPVTGSPEYDSRSYIPAGKHSMSMTIKKAGKVVVTGKITIALDGKSRTVTTTGAEPSMNNTAVYDKQ